MGTRAIVKVKNESDNLILSMYSQFDGYEEGVGRELKDFVNSLKMVNGISGDGKGVANGMGCLAAQIVSHFKENAGGYYLINEEDSDASYLYTIYCEGGFGEQVLYIKVESYGETLYEGKLDDYNP